MAIQDGEGAGQSVPHVHIHILPRNEDCALKGDRIYEELDVWAPRDREGEREGEREKSKESDLSKKERFDRTTEEMAEEANIYRELLSKM